MGGNVTRTPLNQTNSTGPVDNGGKSSQTIKDPVPPFRQSQELTVVTIQVSFALVLIAGALTINIIMTVILHRKMKSLPYTMLMNVVAVDIATALLNGPFFVFGIMLDQLGLIIQNYCNVQGFFHASFSAVFLNTVTLIAISRCLVVLRPDLYHKIFVNKTVMRFLLIGLWSTSALLCVPPLNHKGWGAYKRFEATCWLAWIPYNVDYVAYNSLITILTLGTALVGTIFGLYVVFSIRKSGAVAPAQTVPTPALPAYPGAATVPGPGHDGTPCLNTRLNTEILIIVSFQLLVYIVLWVPLTVMNSIYLMDWRELEFRAITFFLYMFMGRMIFNPIICLAVSADIRKELISTILQCRCSKRETPSNDIEL